MKKRLGSLLLLAALSLMPIRSATASCADLTLQQKIEMADVIVLGEVTQVGSSLTGRTEYTIAVGRLYKGSVPNPLLIRSEFGNAVATSIDYKMEKREVHTLYLKKKDDALRTDICTGSHLGAPTAEEKALLGEGGPAASPLPTRSWIPLIAFSVAIGAIGLVLLSGRRTRR